VGCGRAARGRSVICRKWAREELTERKGASALAVRGRFLLSGIRRAGRGVRSYPCSEHLTDEVRRPPSLRGGDGVERAFRLRRGESSRAPACLCRAPRACRSFLQFAAGRRNASSPSVSRGRKLAASGDGGVRRHQTYRTTADGASRSRQLNGGARPVDHVIELGGAGPWLSRLRDVRKSGHVALIGVLSGLRPVSNPPPPPTPPPTPPVALLMKGVRITGNLRRSRDIVRDD